MQREQYLRYFNHNPKKSSENVIYNRHQPSNQSRSLHLNKSRVQKKLLPHISEEYQYKITNQLLVQKIINPKRDRLIIQSFHRSPSRLVTRKEKSRQQTTIYKDRQPQSLDVKRNENQSIRPQHNSLYSRIRKDQSNTKKKTIKSYVQEFNLSLQNERMGRRIIKTKSSVQELLKKTFFTYKNNIKSNKQGDKENHQTDLKNSFMRGKDKSRVYFSGKNNNGLKVFSNPVKDDQKSLSRSQSLYQTQRTEKSLSNKKEEKKQFQTTLQNSFKQNQIRKNKTAVNLKSRFIRNQQINTVESQHMEAIHPQSFKLFGKGPTILRIYDLEIVSNPPIKDNTMLILELITHEKLINLREKKEKAIKTIPFPYEFIKPRIDKNLPSNCFRFAINASGIGDFVPLRIYKLNGVEISELGIIDIDLAAFRYRKQEFSDEPSQILTKQQKIQKNGQKMERDIISGSSKGNLRKNLLYKPVQTKVSLNYKIYPKKYKIIDHNQSNQS